MSSWLYKPRCTSRLQRIFRDIEFKKKRTFPQPSIMEIQDKLKPKISGYQNDLKRQLEVMMENVNKDYLVKEKEVENMDESEIGNFVDGYEYRMKQLMEMMGFLMGALEKACNNEKEMLEKLAKDERLVDIVNYIKEGEEEDRKLKEKEELLKNKLKDEEKMKEVEENEEEDTKEKDKEGNKEELGPSDLS